MLILNTFKDIIKINNPLYKDNDKEILNYFILILLSTIEYKSWIFLKWTMLDFWQIDSKKFNKNIKILKNIFTNENIDNTIEEIENELNLVEDNYLEFFITNLVIEWIIDYKKNWTFFLTDKGIFMIEKFNIK